MSKDHAIHNESVCDMLLADNQYYDWVVTTAFYSALHFVRHELFPLIENGQTYPNFDIYCLRNGNKVSKHTITKSLVQKYLPTVAPYYTWLMDACWTARYKNYKTIQQEAARARQFLSILKSQMTK